MQPDPLCCRKSIDEFVQVEKRLADPGGEVPVELEFAGMVKRQAGKFEDPGVDVSLDTTSRQAQPISGPGNPR